MKLFTYEIFSASILLLLFSCNKKEINITTIDSEIKINELSFDSIYEGCFNNCFIIDSLLFLTSTCDENKIHVFNAKSVKLVKKFGTSGLAPFEMQNIQPFSNISLFHKNNKILFFDAQLFHEKRINYKNILLGFPERDNIESIPLDKELFFSWDLTYLNDNFLCGRSIDESEGLFFLYDKATKKKNWIPYNKTFNIEKKYNLLLFYGVLNASISKSTIIFASRHFDCVLFYDFDGNLKNEYYFSAQKKPEFSKTFTGVSHDAVVYALSIYATKDYFYVLRVSQSMNEMVYSPKESSQILVFTSEGILKKAFRISHLTYKICIDENNKILYTFRSNEEENNPFVKVVKYDISEHLK